MGIISNIIRGTKKTEEVKTPTREESLKKLEEQKALFEQDTKKKELEFNLYKIERQREIDKTRDEEAGWQAKLVEALKKGAPVDRIVNRIEILQNHIAKIRAGIDRNEDVLFEYKRVLSALKDRIATAKLNTSSNSIGFNDIKGMLITLSANDDNSESNSLKELIDTLDSLDMTDAAGYSNSVISDRGQEIIARANAVIQAAEVSPNQVSNEEIVRSIMENDN